VWSNGVLEYWSTGVVRFVAAAFCLATDYWLLWGATEHVADEQARPYQSPITNHLSRSPPRSINERARGQDDNQDGSFGSDLPVR
jgi:hypothetical protein